MTFDVRGAWTRQSVTIGGGPPFETQLVVWLQAERCYADLRVPITKGAQYRCFAGRSGWDGDVYRWTHRLDLERDSPAADDAGHLVQEGEAVVERGMFPTLDGPVAYEEVWVRLPGGDRPVLALEGPDGSFVQIGDHAIVVTAGDGLAAAYYRRSAGAGVGANARWDVVASIGEVTGLARPDAPPHDWLVVERTDE